MKYYVYNIHSNPMHNEKGQRLKEWLRKNLERAMIEGDFLDDLLSCIKAKVYSLNSEHRRTKPWGVTIRYNKVTNDMCWITAGPINKDGNESTITVTFIEIRKEIKLNDLAGF